MIALRGLIVTVLVLVSSWAIADGGGNTLPKIKPGEPLPANLFVELAKLVNPSVVNVFTTYLPQRRMMGNDPFRDMLEQFMGQPRGMQMAPQQALGTGFIIRDDGLILTNNHVIDRADGIKVQISEEAHDAFDARLIGRDARSDIALIKINAKRKLPFVKLGNSANVSVGEWVAAFGNPYGYGHTMTKGIISALGREIEDLNSQFPFMQTDASINPGNSGGPLVNTEGEVIGVNTAIDARAQGIGFVIPIDNVKNILPQLEKDGGIKHAFLGVRMADLDEEHAGSLNIGQTDGALITEVMPGGSAEKAGLQTYDLVTELNGKKVTSTHDLQKAVQAAPVGQNFSLKVVRNGKSKVLSGKMLAEGEAESLLRGSRRERGSPLGTPAPYQLGFALSEYSAAMAQELGLPRLDQPRPVVVAVDPNGEAAKAGLAPGDLILDINRQPVQHVRDATKALRKGAMNILRVLKQDRVVLISVKAQ